MQTLSLEFRRNGPQPLVIRSFATPTAVLRVSTGITLPRRLQLFSRGSQDLPHRRPSSMLTTSHAVFPPSDTFTMPPPKGPISLLSSRRQLPLRINHFFVRLRILGCTVTRSELDFIHYSVEVLISVPGFFCHVTAWYLSRYHRIFFPST